jgi:hypothetical protein
MIYKTITVFSSCLLIISCFENSSGDKNKAENSNSLPSAAIHTSSSLQKNAMAQNLKFGTLDTLTGDISNNPVAYIPPQCYTRPTTDEKTYNPCYVCHTSSKEPNFLNDIDVQLNYNFPETGLTNNWLNVFKDRSQKISALSDEKITRYVKQDNYFSENGGIILAAKLKNPPIEWDRNKNGLWDGYKPDVYFSFNAQGFDQAPNGAFTGWRAFAYYPFPGTFMPTNGSTDDVMVRLPEVFRQLEAGQYDEKTYIVNLAIIEALMKEKDVIIDWVDERIFGVDLDKNGELTETNVIKYDWAPLEGRNMSYVGQAKLALESGKVHLAKRLYPEGTEFIHSVRYLEVTDQGIKMAARMKELRYSRKNSWRSYHQLRTIVDNEVKERHDFPDRTKVVTGDMETGLNIAQGWTYQGFIEDDIGELRPQTHEETYFCTGCHGYIGASNDTTISFSRKLGHNAFQNGWYHWQDKGLENTPDPLREDGRGEYEYYLSQNPTGNEYRNNLEVVSKFFNENGTKKKKAFELLSNDITYLLMPTAERAMALNKAYKIIVEEQSYHLGRDPIIKPLNTVRHSVEIEEETGIKAVLNYY